VNSVNSSRGCFLATGAMSSSIHAPFWSGTTQSPSYALPAHFWVGPDLADLRRAHVRGLPLPLREDFGDAYEGRCFVRFHRTKSLQAVHGREARRRSDPPVMINSIWFPDRCIPGCHSLEVVARSRLRPRTTAAIRGTAARPVSARR